MIDRNDQNPEREPHEPDPVAMNAAAEKFIAEGERLIGPYRRVVYAEAGLFAGRASCGRIGFVKEAWMELIKGRKEREIAALFVSLMRVVEDMTRELERDHGLQIREHMLEFFIGMLGGGGGVVSAGIKHDGSMRLDDRGRSHDDTQAGD